LEARNAAMPAAKLLRFGTKVNALFTLMRRARYAFAMLLLFAAAAALAASPPSNGWSPSSAAVSAQATVRIISGAVLRLGKGPQTGDAPLAQATYVHLSGMAQPAKLIEFE
jgi:uncharacterized membrane protein